MLHRLGAEVVVLDLPQSEGDRVVGDLGDRATFVPGDVRSGADVAAAIGAAAESGELRIVVNCAGVATPGRILGRQGVLPLEEFSRVVDINLVGTFNVLRLAAEKMSTYAHLGEERGVVIMTASVAAFEGQVGQAAYAASKAGVAGLTICAARDLADLAIRVVTIAPGIFETPMMAGLPEAAQQSLGQQTPHPRRLGRPDEYAALARHIVENIMLNGATIRLDGAIRMAPR
jgi:NAD(P)-dependent dehydrogenase (short-subunit alcohol dehydrogenase family)